MTDTESTYWDDKSVNQYQERPDSTPPNPGWNNRGNFVPYRGEEQHGVAFDSRPEDFSPTPADTSAVNDPESYEPPYDEILTDPIPVKVVGYPTPIAEQKRLRTNTVLVSDTAAVLIASRRPERTKLVIGQNTEPLIIGSSDSALAQLGFTVPPNSLLELGTNQEVWAIRPSGTSASSVSILEEYTSTSGGDIF